MKSKAHPSLIGKPLFNGTLSDKQWALLDEMQKEMQSEYQMRREMLIKRLDVTVQSFQVCFHIGLYHKGSGIGNVLNCFIFSMHISRLLHTKAYRLQLNKPKLVCNTVIYECKTFIQRKVPISKYLLVLFIISICNVFLL